MKTSALIRIFLYTFIAIVLVGVLIWGIAGNHNANFFSFNLFGASGMGYNDKGYTVGDGSATRADVSKIQVNWTAGDVKIVPYIGDTTGRDEIFFSEESGTPLEADYKMRYKVEDGVLKIMFAKPNVKFKGIFKSLDKELTINVPTGTTFSEVNIDTVSANIDLESIQATRFGLATVSGDLNGAMLIGDAMDMETVSGDVQWTEAQLGAVAMESVSGRINTRFTSMPTDIHMETVSGEMTIGLPENDGFKVDYDKVSGNFDCEFNVKINKNMALYKDGGSKITLETVSGDMIILKI